MRPNVLIAKRQKIPAAYSLLMLSWTMAFRLRVQSEREGRGGEEGEEGGISEAFDGKSKLCFATYDAMLKQYCF